MGKANLFPEFKEFFASLNKAKIKYLLIGGYAVNYYGHHRHTKDLDVWVAMEAENIEKLSEVLQIWGGFSAATVAPKVLLEPDKVFVFGVAPTRIDILTTPIGVNFNECWERRVVDEFDGIRVPIISLTDLLVNKKASGRLRDLSDVDYLTRPKKAVERRKK